MVFYLFDLLHLDGDDLTASKERLASLLPANGSPLHYSDHVLGQGPAFYAQACTLAVEGIVSKRADAPSPTRASRWLRPAANVYFTGAPRGLGQALERLRKIFHA